MISTDKEIIKSQRGNGQLPTVGTWGHPKLAVFFARWLDVKFAVFCDMVIDDILSKKAEVVITKPEDPEGRRRKLVRLTDKGMGTAASVVSLVRKVPTVAHC